jgi:hypothetical protein
VTDGGDMRLCYFFEWVNIWNGCAYIWYDKDHVFVAWWEEQAK